ncbi:MAG: lytic transglycosylase F, partial [Proteiniphilum sp.]|nr:lytic transglycosylase F [Proteiniphilum sp.]
MKTNLIYLTLLLLLLSSCTIFTKRNDKAVDFPLILERDTLTILTVNSSTSYFIYRDQPMGYHYDMIREFCRHHGLVPEIIVAPGTASLMRMLLEGVGDVIAYHVPVT